MTTSIVLDKLSKRFGAGAPAVDSVSLRIEAGELFFLLGPSGCGKTTLLRMVAGFIEPTAGTVVFEQPSVGGGAPVRRDVTSLPPNKRNTGMVFQSYALWPHMSVEANVGFGLSVRGVSADEKRRRVGEALELVRMSEYAARKPNQLSGGQQQRVALARALVIRPDVLLLDEPLSNLDAKLRIELRTEIRRICKEARSGAGTQGMTAIYVTHDQKEALSMADRVAIMRAGRVVQIGTPEQLYRDPGSAFVAEFLGETNFIPGTVEAGAGPGQVRVRTPAGSLTGRAPAGAALGAGTRVLCSVRPESIRAEAAAPGPNLLAGSVSRRTYLGEMAQLDVQLRVGPGAACVPLKVSVMNPPSSPPSSAPGDRAEARAGTWGPEIALWVDPQDVVILPEPA